MERRFPGRAKVRRGPTTRAIFRQRWLNGQELEGVFQILEEVGVTSFGFSKEESRELAYKSIQQAKVEFDSQVMVGSTDEGRKGH